MDIPSPAGSPSTKLALPLRPWPLKPPSKIPRRGLLPGASASKALFVRLREEVLLELEAVLFARRCRLMLVGSTSGMLASVANTERTEIGSSAVVYDKLRVTGVPSIMETTPERAEENASSASVMNTRCALAVRTS